MKVVLWDRLLNTTSFSYRFDKFLNVNMTNTPSLFLGETVASYIFPTKSNDIFDNEAHIYFTTSLG